MPHFCSVCQHCRPKPDPVCWEIRYLLIGFDFYRKFDFFFLSHISPCDHLFLEGSIRANRLAPEGRWGPESHPRRCSVLWVFSQVSVCESLLCLDRRLKQDVKCWNDLYFWSVSLFLISYHTRCAQPWVVSAPWPVGRELFDAAESADWELSELPEKLSKKINKIKINARY